MRKLLKVIKAEEINMGGIILDQALPVRGINYIDPYILIHHWKQIYKGNKKQSEIGVGPHPHRGFAPVTLIFEGGVYHQDSIGNKSLVEKGGTQWMNSGSGIVHSERPAKHIAEKGGEFEIIQFWVNAPAKNKMESPNYQPLSYEETPVIISDGGLVNISLIAGEFSGIKGKIKTYSELLVLRIDMSKGGKISIPIPENFNALLYQLDGKLKVNNETVTMTKELSMFDSVGDKISIEALEDTRAILLAGMPINEEMVTYGPFVMNSKEEIHQAVTDYHQGKMGTLIEDFPEVQLQN